FVVQLAHHVRGGGGADVRGDGDVVAPQVDQARDVADAQAVDRVDRVHERAHVHARDAVEQVGERDVVAAEVGEDRDGRLQQVDHGLQRLGHRLYLAHDRPEEAVEERADVEADVVERQGRVAGAVLGEAPVPVEVGGEPQAEPGVRVAQRGAQLEVQVGAAAQGGRDLDVAAGGRDVHGVAGAERG